MHYESLWKYLRDVSKWPIRQWRRTHACMLLSLNRTSSSLGWGRQWSDPIATGTLCTTCGLMEKLRTHKINLHSDHCDSWQKGLKQGLTTVVPSYLVQFLQAAKKAAYSRIRHLKWEQERDHIEATLLQDHTHTASVTEYCYHYSIFSVSVDC